MTIKFSEPATALVITVNAAENDKPVLLKDFIAVSIEDNVFYISPRLGPIDGPTPVQIYEEYFNVIINEEMGYQAYLEQVIFMGTNVGEAKLIINGVTYTVS